MQRTKGNTHLARISRRIILKQINSIRFHFLAVGVLFLSVNAGFSQNINWISDTISNLDVTVTGTGGFAGLGTVSPSGFWNINCGFSFSQTEPQGGILNTGGDLSSVLNLHWSV